VRVHQKSDVENSEMYQIIMKEYTDMFMDSKNRREKRTVVLDVLLLKNKKKQVKSILLMTGCDMNL